MEGPYKYSRKLERRAASLFVLSTGRQRCDAACGWGPGVRDHYLLHHILSGKGTLVVEEQSFSLSAGDTFLICPDTSVHYFADPQDPWEYIWVGFGGMDAARYMDMTRLTPEAPVLSGDRAVGPLMEAVYNAFGDSVCENLAMTARLYDLLSHLLSVCGREEDWEQVDCAEAAAQYIMAHFAEPVTVEEIAKRFSISHSSLYRKFVRRYNVSPKRFLLEYRIDRACHLLVNTPYSVQEISNSVGFEDPFYFSRVFKEIRGESPRRYANRQKKTESELKAEEA